MALTRTFYSTDTGAPQLKISGGSGYDAVDFFNAILVDGYNSQSGLAISRTGGTATVTKTSHGYRTGQIVLIAGADQAGYNGEFRVAVVDANTFTYSVSGSPATPATGSITSKVAPVGWSLAYSATGVAVFRSPSGTNQFYYRFSQPLNYDPCYLRGYETMSDANTGTGPFPTVAQSADGVHFFPTSFYSTARPYRVFSDGKVVYVFADRSGTSLMSAIHFGDLPANIPGDAHCSFVNGQSGSSSLALQSPMTQINGVTTLNLYFARISAGTGASSRGTLCSDFGISMASSSSQTVLGTGQMPYPSPDSVIYLSAVRAFDGSRALRAILPGIVVPCHSSLPYSHLQSVTGVGDLAGKDFLAMNLDGSGQVLVETSDGWGT